MPPTSFKNVNGSEQFWVLFVGGEVGKTYASLSRKMGFWAMTVLLLVGISVIP